MSRPKNLRLQFTDAERGDPRLKEHIRRADKAADQADAARKKVPKKKKPVKQRTVDPATGKAKTRLRFEEVDKPAPVSKLTHAVQAAPVHAAAGTVHRKISETEHDNVGVESAHRLEESAEGGARLAAHSYRSQKLRPYREGDSLRMIHWKMTAKRDELVTREPPEDTRPLPVLTFDHFGPLAQVDRALDRLAGLSLTLLDQERPHEVRWAHPETGAVRAFPVTGERDWETCLTAILSDPAPLYGRSILSQALAPVAGRPIYQIHVSGKEDPHGKT